MTAYQVTARNFSTSSENRMHSDDVANRYGFKGALVPGVAIYGHLVKPFVDHFGPMAQRQLRRGEVNQTNL